jgi:DNA-directed RNA polymerase subunit H (RpoH/RPB5)
MFKLLHNKKEITAITRLTLDSQNDTITTSLNFERAINIKFVEYEQLSVGDIVKLYKDSEFINKYVIYEKEFDGKNKEVFTCLDYGFYLANNKRVYNFNTSASNCIKKICNDFKIKLDMPNLTTKINKIYYSETITDTILDILEQVKNETSTTYYAEMQDETLIIYKQYSKTLDLVFKLASNIKDVKSYKALMNYSKTESIEALRNKITLVQEQENAVKTIAETQDNTSIGKYGTLQEVLTIDDKDIAKARNIAKNKLKELNKVKNTLSVTLLTNNKIQAGRVIKIVENSKNYYYEIVSCNVEIVNNNQICNLSLEEVTQ